MAAWGEGLAENDAAVDLLAAIGDALPQERRSLLEARLLRVGDRAAPLEGSHVEEALVAGLLVLVAAGGTPPRSAGDVTGAAALGRTLAPPDAALLARAGRALARAAEPSGNEWLELWDEAGELEAARRRVRDLSDALSSVGGVPAGWERRLTLVDETSDKYWNILCDGVSVTVDYGRTGTSGQSRTKTYDSADTARREAEKQVAGKLKKGYVDLGSAAGTAVAPAADLPDAEDQGVAFFRDGVRALVRPGFVSLDEALERLLEQADDDPAIPLGPVEAEAVVRQEWAQRLEELSDGRPGDDVGVQAAFQSLRDLGYVAELNVGYSLSDAWPELGEQVQASRAQGLVFCHGQDAERLADSPAELYLGFDCVTGKDREMVAVARVAVQALTAQGLTVEWGGSAGTRIKVIGLDWRQPLPGSAPAAAP